MWAEAVVVHGERLWARSRGLSQCSAKGVPDVLSRLLSAGEVGKRFIFHSLSLSLAPLLLSLFVYEKILENLLGLHPLLYRGEDGSQGNISPEGTTSHFTLTTWLLRPKLKTYNEIQ